MPSPQVSLDQWRELFAAADAFRQLAPWQWMTDDMLFGVRNPADGELAFCSVLGTLGQCLGLAAYRGAAGLAMVTRLAAGGADPGADDIRFGQQSLVAFYSDRGELSKEDLALIKSLELKYRGPQVWPQFRSMRPGYHPWYLDPAEVAFMILILREALDVTRRLKDQPNLLTSAEPDQYRFRVQQADGQWADEWLVPTFPEPAPDITWRLDEVRLARLKAAAQGGGGVLETDAFYVSSPVQEKKHERPYFPRMAVWIERESGAAIGFDALAPGDAVGPVLIERFLEIVEQNQFLPATILARKPGILRALAPVAAKLGVELRQCEELPGVDDLREHMANFV